MQISRQLTNCQCYYQKHVGGYSSITQFFLNGGNGTEVLDQLQGDLVNFVNAFDLNYLHQLQTSLHGPVTKVYKDSEEITVLIFEDPFMMLQKKQIKHSPIVVNQQQVQQPEIEEIWMAPPPEDFDAVGEDVDNGDDVDSDIINNEVEATNPAIHHAFTGGSQELDSLVELYTMLDKRGVANTLFDKITKWAWLNAGTFGNTPPMKRDLVVHKVFRHVRGNNYKDFMHPKQKIIRLSTGRLVAITYFPLENMIKDLLYNATLMDKENLLFSNFSNPLDDGTSNDPSLFGDVDTGTWWKCAKQHECREQRDVLWPLIMFIDGMKVDEMSGKLKLEPISFTFSRFKRFVRHQDNAWRTWAYIEDVKQPPRLRPVGEENAMLTSKDRLQEYHDILRFLMNDLKRVQDDGIPWTLDFGEEGKHDVVLRLPIQFIIGDCEGHDKLAGRYKGHTQNIKGLCRDCDVPTQHADDENWICSFFNQSEMDALNEDDLNAKSFHKLQNGLQGVSIGGCERGIYGILIPEMLHLYKNGHWCDWQFEAFAFSLSTRSTDISTQVSAFFVNSNRRQSDRSYPDIGTFCYGIITSQGVVLKGHQKHARIFFIYLLLSCSEFVKSLDYNQKRGSGYDVMFYAEFLQMLEHSLAFYEWSMKREHDINTIIGQDGTTETSKAQESIRRYLSLMKRCCLREEMGKTYKMPKFHQSLHLVTAIVRHGSLANVDGSRPESMAKGNVKDPASHTQRVTSKLSYQTGKRYMESLTFREYKRLRLETDSCSSHDIR